MTETGTRELEDMLSPDRLQIHTDFAVRMERAAAGEKGFDAHKAILAYLRQFLLTIPFEEGAIRTAWKVEDEEWAHREVEEAYRLIATEAGAKLRSVPNKAAATFAMWRTAGIPVPEQVLEQLFASLQPDSRQRAFVLIQQRVGTISPVDQLLQAAQALQGKDDVIPTMLKALRMMSIEPSELVQVATDNPVVAMLAVSERLVTEGGKSFTRKVAEKLVEAGITPESAYDQLKDGKTSPSKLYGSNGSS